MEWFIENGIGYLVLGLVVGAIFVGGAWLSRRGGEKLDSELTAYVAEGTVTAETARAILETRARIGRKREVAALIAGGMEASQGLSLLESMAAE